MLKENRLQVLKRSLYILFLFGTGDYKLAGSKYQESDLRFFHSVDQAREKLRLKYYKL